MNVSLRVNHRNGDHMGDGWEEGWTFTRTDGEMYCLDHEEIPAFLATVHLQN